MRNMALKDLCIMKSGGTPSRKNPSFYEGEIPWAKISDLEFSPDGYIHDTKEHITQEALASINNRFFDAGTLFLAMYGSVGKTGISKIPMTTNQAILGINIKEKDLLDIDYLKYWFKTIKQRLLNRAVGAALPNISLTIVKELKIPLPPLDQQNKIATILDAADAYRQKTKALIANYDALTQSLFLDMFGNPVANPMGWKVVNFSDVGKLDRGKSKHRPRNAPELLGGIHPLIQTGNLANCGVYLKEYTSTYSDIGLAQSKKWPSGTLCITIAANIAKTGILTFDACFPDSVVGFIPNQKTNNLYTLFWLSFLQKILEETAPESAQKNINLGILRALDFPLPPIELQNQFAERVQAIEAQKAQAQASLAQAEDLFNSILQRAFKGELV